MNDSTDSTLARFTQALEELKQRQKTSKGAPAYSRFVNRRLGRVFAAAASVLKMTPNQVTAVSASFTFAGILCVMFVEPSIATSLVIVVLLVVGYALDAADGQLARLYGGGSVVGEWLDHVVDALKIATIHTAVLINWYRFGDVAPVQLLIPITYQAAASVLFFSMILNDQLRRARRKSTEMILQGDGSSSLLYAIAVVPTDYGILCLSFSLMFWTT